MHNNHCHRVTAHLQSNIYIFLTCSYGSWGPPSLLYNVYRVFPGGKERLRRDADPSPLLVPWSRKSRTIPILPLWAVRPVQRHSVCTRVHFIYIYIYIYISWLWGGGQSVATEIKVNTEFRWLQSPVADRPQFRSRNIDVWNV